MFSTFDGVSEKREDRVADEWVTQLLRQSDARVFKKYSQMKLQMKREALLKLHLIPDVV